MTPYELWYGRKPSLNHMRIWGCPAHVKKISLDKLETRTEMCLFIGYPKKTKGYWFYNPGEQICVVSRNATFLEEEFIQDAGEMEMIALEEQSDNPIERYEETEKESNEPTPSLRHSIRELRRPNRYLYMGEEINPNIEETDPLNYREVMLDINARKWLDAMKFEMDSMYSNKV
ncbi:uncharacterized protein LOC143857067 [Tasmannia lanceolata]|uniref:uncharacterized protein LOC143857067 n=1 Tax=Tasmannia lanceolata TaxID=3420 RepID=UPI0040631E08